MNKEPYQIPLLLGITPLGDAPSILSGLSGQVDEFDNFGLGGELEIEE